MKDLYPKIHSPNAGDEVSFTLLHWAAGLNDSLTIIALVDAGADVNARDRDGLTPMHIAAWFTDNPAVITALLNAGADPKAKDNGGRTPWYYAQYNKAIKGTDAHWRINEFRF